MSQDNPLVIGINYWPGETATDWWKRFEPSIVKRDFSLLAEYRLELARIFLLWEDFQPEMKRISVKALENLVRAADIAHDLGIRLLPTFFCGHMRGVNWLSPWMVESGMGEEKFPLFSGGEVRRGRVRNLYADREVWKAQKLLIHETTSALQGYPSVWGWDLGNRISSLALPASKNSVRAWLEEMVTELKRWDAALPITVGVHQNDLYEGRIPGPKEIAPLCEVLSVHAYPGDAPWANGPLDEKVPLFLCLLTRWLGGKKVLLEEFGVPTEPHLYSQSDADREKLGNIRLVEEDEAETFFEKSLDLLKKEGIAGALAWCLYDFDSSLWEKLPFKERIHERYFGLFRGDRSPKMAARLIQQYPRAGRLGEMSYEWADITQEEYYEKPQAHLPRLYRNFQDQIR